MKTRMSLKTRQGGAVAVIVGFSLVLLVGFLAMVIDLGHLYIAKTELQNGADAAALAGAKELDGSKLGVQNAITAAVAVARKNNFDLQNKPVGTQDTDGGLVISVGSCPKDTGCNWMLASEVSTEAEAADKTFLKVDTRNSNVDRRIDTWFAPIWGIFKTETYGMAVAGRYITPITPIGICAIDPDNPGRDISGQDPVKYKAYYGFRLGVSYNFAAVNRDIGGLAAGTELYLHPTATSQETCNPSGGNANFMAPFLCTGRSAISGAEGSTVYANTGLAAGMSIAALNTRFDQYGPPLDSALDHTVCPPDKNIKQFTPAMAQYVDPTSGWMNATELPIEQTVIPELARWLANPGDDTSVPSQIRNKKENQGGCKDTGAGDCSDNYGVLWSYNTEIKTNVTPNEPAAWTAWPQKGLYPDGPTAIWAQTNPPYVHGINNPSQTETPFFKPPAVNHDGLNDRRVLNVVIVRCSGDPGICGALPVLGVGRFFMQVPASVADFIAGEFAGLLPQPFPPTDIRLYQ